MALQNVQRIQIELDGSAPFEYVVAKAGEKESRIVEVTLLENKKEFTIPAGTTAKIKYYKPDGKFVLNNATISGNVITDIYRADAGSFRHWAWGNCFIQRNSRITKRNVLHEDYANGVQGKRADKR